jgi:hypothetical protein
MKNNKTFFEALGELADARDALMAPFLKQIERVVIWLDNLLRRFV